VIRKRHFDFLGGKCVACVLMSVSGGPNDYDACIGVDC
jgi:hypothetical protein